MSMPRKLVSRRLLRLFLTLVFTSGCGQADGTKSAAVSKVNQTTAVDQAAAAQAMPADSTPSASAGKTVVLWISVDGVRGDYVDRGQSPFLKSLMEHGAYTRQLTPIFPSLTFPSHTSEATGVAAGVHGIVSNKWFDLAAGQEFNMPSDPKLLQSEPIWITASRQGVRSAVLDWPLSQGEDKLPADAARAAIFNERYVLELTDEQRLENVVAAYRKDSSDPKNTAPLQLLMGYVHDVDSAGHKYGPDAPETNKAIRDDDQVLEKIVGEVAEIFKQHMHPEQGDALYVLITTDHGMDNVKTLVNLQKLLGDTGADGTVRGVTSGSFANIYLDGVPGAHARRLRKLFWNIWPSIRS